MQWDKQNMDRTDEVKKEVKWDAMSIQTTGDLRKQTCSGRNE